MKKSRPHSRETTTTTYVDCCLAAVRITLTSQPAVLVDNASITDLLAGNASTGWSDTDYCAQIKALCLLNKATRSVIKKQTHSDPAEPDLRLYDIPSASVTGDRLANLKQVTTGYMASLPVLDNIGVGSKIGPRSQAWQMLHLYVELWKTSGRADGRTMVFLHLREAVDLPDESPQYKSCIDGAVDSAEHLVSAIDILSATGDAELGTCRAAMLHREGGKADMQSDTI